MVKKISHLPDIATDQPYVDDEPFTVEGTDTGSGTMIDTFAAKPEEVIMEVVNILALSLNFCSGVYLFVDKTKNGCWRGFQKKLKSNL